MCFSSQTAQLISEALVQILKEKPPGGPLVLGLSVFTVASKCNINLGVKGWAELCSLVASEADGKNLDGLLSFLQNPQQ